MYQREYAAPSPPGIDAYLSACTNTAPTPDNVAIVRSMSSLLRLALDVDDVRPLREFLEIVRERCDNVADLLAAAQFEVCDKLMRLPVKKLQECVRRLAAIVREVLPIESFSMHMEGFAAQLAVG